MGSVRALAGPVPGLSSAWAGENVKKTLDNLLDKEQSVENFGISGISVAPKRAHRDSSTRIYNAGDNVDKMVIAIGYTRINNTEPLGEIEGLMRRRKDRNVSHLHYPSLH
jgi:hypothetical protein